MRLVLDAGAFVAVERGNRKLSALVKGEHLAGRDPLTHGGVIGQVWRSGTGRQAPVASLLRAIETVPLDEELGRQTGALLAQAGSSDVIDAALVLLANDGDEVITSDPEDIAALADAAGLQIDVVEI